MITDNLRLKRILQKKTLSHTDMVQDTGPIIQQINEIRHNWKHMIKHRCNSICLRHQVKDEEKASFWRLALFMKNLGAQKINANVSFLKGRKRQKI